MTSKTIAVTLHAIEVSKGRKVALVFDGSDSKKHRRTYAMSDFMVVLFYITAADRESRMVGLAKLGAMRRRVTPLADVYDLRADGDETLNLGSDEGGPCIQTLFSMLRKESANVPRIRQALREEGDVTISAHP